MKNIILPLLVALGGALQPALAQQPAAVAGTRPLPAAPVRPGMAPLRARAQVAARAVTLQLPTRVSTSGWLAANSAWDNPVVSTYSYDARGNVAQITRVDSVTQLPSRRLTYSSNAANQPTLVLTETWAGAAWQNSTRTQYTYDGAGHETEILAQDWDGSAWLNARRWQNTYDAQGNITLSLVQQWTNNAWALEYGAQLAFVYDAQQRVTEQSQSDWNRNTQTYVPGYRYQFSYSGTTSNYTSYVYQQWSNNAWENMTRNTAFVYDAQNHVSYVELQNWVGGNWQTDYRYVTTSEPGASVMVGQQLNGTAWVNVTRTSFLTDAQGNENGTYLFENWDGAAWMLNSGVRFLDAYNAANNLVRRLVQVVDGTPKAFVNYEKSYYSNFQSIVLAARPISALQSAVQLYPNPTTSNATLELSGLREQGPVQIDVLNPLGQPVLTLAARPRQGVISQRLDVSSLPAGLYSVRIRTAEGTVVKRLVRE